MNFIDENLVGNLMTQYITFYVTYIMNDAATKQTKQIIYHSAKKSLCISLRIFKQFGDHGNACLRIVNCSESWILSNQRVNTN